MARLDPFGTLLAAGGELLTGAAAFGLDLDLDSALASTDTVQVVGGLATPPDVEISIIREEAVE